ncbi:hypothetical protein BGZ82_007031 [Podila clonocystis]|nr:hypothetical protein BGZ82_007031 [Podila clonocystis]
MSALLCDIYSVDLQILFGSTRNSKEICLWAHRTILARNHGFNVLLKQISFACQSSGVAPLLLVTNVSFPVFAVLLKFLYTGEIQRVNLYPEDFAISKSGCYGGGGAKDSHSWHSMDTGLPLSDKPITWQELLDAATIYRLDGLRARCRAEIVAAAKDEGSDSCDTK